MAGTFQENKKKVLSPVELTLQQEETESKLTNKQTIKMLVKEKFCGRVKSEWGLEVNE